MFALVLVGAAVNGQICGSPPSDQACRATQDFWLVVDNSASVSHVEDDLTNFMYEFAARFSLVAGDALSPRIGIVTFNGPDWNTCIGCSVSFVVQAVCIGGATRVLSI